MSDSFFPAARRVLRNPIVKWSNRVVLASLTGLVTTVVWPDTAAWVSSRADQTSVDALETRLRVIELSREVDYAKLYQSDKNSGMLNDKEQVQWALLRINTLRYELTREVRARLGLEVILLYSNPRSDRARRMASTAKAKFDDFVQRGEDPDAAARRALEHVWDNFTHP